MRDGPSDFLLQGLSHYPDAFTAVHEFRRQLRERVIARIRAFPWKAWQPDLKGLKPTHGESDGLWLGAGGRGGVTGRSEAIVLDIGLWWRTADGVSTCEAGVSLHEGPAWLQQPWTLPAPLRARGVLTSKRYLYLPLPATAPDLDASLDTVLAAFDACLALAVAG